MTWDVHDACFCPSPWNLWHAVINSTPLFIYNTNENAMRWKIDVAIYLSDSGRKVGKFYLFFHVLSFRVVRACVWWTWHTTAVQSTAAFSNIYFVADVFVPFVYPVICLSQCEGRCCWLAVKSAQVSRERASSNGFPIIHLQKCLHLAANTDC